jgi:hypothetical protein
VRSAVATALNTWSYRPVLDEMGIGFKCDDDVVPSSSAAHPLPLSLSLPTPTDRLGAGSLFAISSRLFHLLDHSFILTWIDRCWIRFAGRTQAMNAPFV